MKKLLSLVLGVSIICSSVTPAAGQIRAGRSLARLKGMPVSGVRVPTNAFSAALHRGVLSQLIFANSTLQNRIAAGQTEGLSQFILNSPAAQRAALLRNDFVALSLVPQAVSVSQRAEAARFYQVSLQQTNTSLRAVQSPLSDFLSYAIQHPTDTEVLAIQNTLTDAAALALVGPREQAGALLNFYESAKNTPFEDLAALIAARGCLRMGAYDELSLLFTQTQHPEVLAGTAAYITENQLPVELPENLTNIEPAANEDLAVFLGQTFPLHELHADASLGATRTWMSLQNLTWPSAAAPAATPVAPAISLANTTPLTLAAPEPLTTSAGRQTAASQRQATPTVTPRSTSARSGIVYSGIPVFAIADAGKRAAQWLRRKFQKQEQGAAPYEEPGLHDSNVRPVYADVEIPARAQTGGDLIGADNDVAEVSIGADGFKLTIEGEDKVEHILHNVDLTVSSSLKNFSPEYNRLALDTNYYFELRNQTIPAKRPDHFYFALSTQKGELNYLLEGARQLNLSRPVRIKIQKTSAPKKSVTLPVFDKDLHEPPVVIAEVDASLLSGIKNPEKGQIWCYNGSIYFRQEDGEVTLMQDAFVRLPKAESKYWIRILEMYPDVQFNLGVFSTKGKMVPVTYLVPSLQIGLGKTLAPVLNDMSTLGETTSSGIMLGINNVLPAMMGFVHPFLKQYGEAAVFRVGASMFTAGGLIALASGLYGHVGSEIMSGWQLTGFLTSSILIALGTNITRFVQNLLMSANRGIVPQASSFQKEVPIENTQVTPTVYNGKFFLKRSWEVLTKKSKKSLRDIVFFQRGAMFKNLGTMLFLSFPWLANMGGKALGYDLGLDFSASYVPYSIYSLYTLRKVMKTRYKDAFPLNPTVLQNNLQDVGQAAALDIAQIPVDQLTAEHPLIIASAQRIKKAIDALTPVEARQTKNTINSLTLKHEEEIGTELENLLRLSPNHTDQQAQAAHTALQQAFDQLGHRNVKLKDVMLMAGLPASLGAMTLATLGELGLSNGLAFAMREMIGNGTAATGIVGILLYGCMFGWRIVGNILSQRMSGGSMYALSSMASVSGPLMMAMAGNNIGMLASGAIIACFGVSNFFSQMYEYMIGLHPQYKREIALLINYTMPAAAIPAALLRATVKASGIQGLDIGIAGLALAASVALTPGMLANSSMVQAFKYWGTNLKNKIKKFLGHSSQIDIPTPGGFIQRNSQDFSNDSAPQETPAS